MDKLPFLPSIAAVDDFLGACYELADDGELSLIVLDRYGFDAKSLWNHRQGSQAPSLPSGSIVMGLFQGTEVPECPRHGVAIPFVVADSFVDPAGSGSEDLGYVTSHAGLFGDADNQ